jgi:energy-coupling factor transport system permease protein
MKNRKSQQILDYTFNFKPGTTFFHKLHPVSKILFAIFFTFIVLIQTSLIVLFGLFIFIVILSLSSGISIKSLLSRLKWIIMIVIITIVINILFNALGKESEILFYLIPEWLTDPPHLPIRRLAAYYAFRISFWILTLSNCGLIFLYTTAPQDIVIGMRSLGIPYKIAYSLMIGLRYVPLIQDNTTTVVIAQKARGLDRTNIKGVKRAWELVRDRLTTALILIFKQIKITAKSLELRGFGQDKKRTDLYKVKFHKRDFIFILLFFIVVTFLSLYRFGVLNFIPQIPSLYSIWLIIFPK